MFKIIADSLAKSKLRETQRYSIHHYQGLNIKLTITAGNMMPPSQLTLATIDQMAINPDGDFLDMGAGCGIIGIAAHFLGVKGRIIFTELPEFMADTFAAVHRNLELNHLKADDDRFHLMASDLFSDLGDMKFASIVFNPPGLPVHEGITFDAWADGGPDGRKLIDPFIVALPHHLVPGGVVTLQHGSLNDVKKTLKQLTELNFSTNVAHKIRRPLQRYVTHNPELLAYVTKPPFSDFITNINGAWYETRYIIRARAPIDTGYSRPLKIIISQ